MDWFKLPTEKERYLGEVIVPHVKRFKYTDHHQTIIQEWRENTPEEVKEHAKSYKELIVRAR